MTETPKLDPICPACSKPHDIGEALEGFAYACKQCRAPLVPMSVDDGSMVMVDDDVEDDEDEDPDLDARLLACDISANRATILAHGADGGEVDEPPPGPPEPRTRPPYGETGAPFVLESARALLANTEHEPRDQVNGDSLWVELRLACDEVEEHERRAKETAMVVGSVAESLASAATMLGAAVTSDLRELALRVAYEVKALVEARKAKPKRRRRTKQQAMRMAKAKAKAKAKKPARRRAPARKR